MSEAETNLQLELSWIDSAVNKSAEAFFDRFELCDKPTAHRRYILLIESRSNNLSGAEKKALADEFEHWKKNKGHKFWLDRRTHLSAMRTAGSLAETAEPYVERSFKRNLSQLEPSEPEVATHQDPLPTTPPRSTFTGIANVMTLSSPDNNGQSHQSFQQEQAFISDDDDVEVDGYVSLEGDDEVMKRGQHEELSPAQKKRRTNKNWIFDTAIKEAFERRFNMLGPKWVLRSGTVVEDELYKAGMECVVSNPVHSFMIDIDDPWIEGKFLLDDWKEICEMSPDIESIPTEAYEYLSKFDNINDLDELNSELSQRPVDVESQLIYKCLLNWLFIYESQDPSPFTIGSLLPERWWQENAWGILDHLTQGVPHCYMLPGELAGIESTARKNAGRYSSNEKKPTKKQMGKRGDMFWRSFNEPKMDWAVVESAKAWDITGDKYIVESTSKLPRQLHDILVNRTREVGSMNMMRKAVVPGLVIGGPVIQQIWLAWGLSGVNVTRIFKYKATRLESSVDMLSQSMDAIYSMLCFRAAVLNLMKQYKTARHQNSIRTQLDRKKALKMVSDVKDGQSVPRNLLLSSPEKPL